MACDGFNAYYRRKYEYQRELTLSGDAHSFSVAEDLHGTAFIYETEKDKQKCAQDPYTKLTLPSCCNNKNAYLKKKLKEIH